MMFLCFAHNHGKFSRAQQPRESTMDALQIVASELKGQLGMVIVFDVCLALILVAIAFPRIASHFGTSREWHVAISLITLLAIGDAFLLSLISPFWVMGVESGILVAWEVFVKASCDAWCETYGRARW